MLRIQTEERIASVVAGGGAIWITHLLATNLARLHQLVAPPLGPIELCGTGIVLWLHAKWRRATRIE